MFNSNNIGKNEGLQLYEKEAMQHRCFPVNIAKLLRTVIFI